MLWQTKTAAKAGRVIPGPTGLHNPQRAAASKPVANADRKERKKTAKGPAAASKNGSGETTAATANAR